MEAVERAELDRPFAPQPRPDPKQIMFAKHWDEALRRVGIIPHDVYTSGGITIRVGARDNPVVILDASIILPFDKFKQAMEIVEHLGNLGSPA